MGGKQAGNNRGAPDPEETVKEEVTVEIFSASVVGRYGISDGHFVRLDWCKWDPFAVFLEIGDHGRQDLQVWEVARELLVDGGGELDVRVRRLADATVVTLAPPGCWVEVHLPAGAVDKFVELMVRAMPIGAEPGLEQIGEDLDEDLQLLLRDEGGAA